MKTINENNFRQLSTEQLSETKGGFYVILILPDGTKVRVWVQSLSFLLIQLKSNKMKTINDNNFRTLSTEQLSETKGGFYVILRLPDGTKVKIWVQ